MHIVHVLTRLLRAGSEENTLATCRAQVAAGHQVTLIHGAEWDHCWDTLESAGIARIGLPEMVHALRPLQDIAALQILRELYRCLKPDVIHTHQSKAGILGRLAADAVPEALVVHGIHIVPFEAVSAARRHAYVAAEKMAARRTDLFIGVSQAAGRAYVEAGIAPAERVHCVRSGMDLAQFQQAVPPGDGERLVGPGRPKVALMMAAFEKRKQHLPFLRAFAESRAARLPGLRLLLAGQGPEEAPVRRAVAELGLQEKVVFCGHRPDPGALLALADVAVLSSAREGLPRVAVQAMAAGVPMVINDLPGIDELVRHECNGLVLAPGDVAGTCDAMARLLEDPARLARLGHGARQTDVSDWALDRLGRDTMSLYAEAAAAARQEAAPVAA